MEASLGIAEKRDWLCSPLYVYLIIFHTYILEAERRIHASVNAIREVYLPWASVTDPDSKVHGVHKGPIWGRQFPGGPHVGPMNFAIWGPILPKSIVCINKSSKPHIWLFFHGQISTVVYFATEARHMWMIACKRNVWMLLFPSSNRRYIEGIILSMGSANERPR